MSEPKHFSYEGHVHLKDGKQVLKPSEPPSVKSVEFLTPAKITFTSGGSELTAMVNIDIINRKVYDAKGELFMSDEVFGHLDSIHNVPDDFYAASEELHDKVADLDGERLRKQEEFLGEQHE